MYQAHINKLREEAWPFLPLFLSSASCFEGACTKHLLLQNATISTTMDMIVRHISLTLISQIAGGKLYKQLLYWRG